MKKNGLLFLALFSWMFFSCSRELGYDTPNPDQIEQLTGQTLTVRATIGETEETRTAVQPDGTSIYWTPGDAINLFYGTVSSGQFTTAIEAPALTTDFNGALSVATGTSTENGVTTQSFWGVYPYNAANSCTGDGVILTIPSNQSGIAGSFADKLNPSVATSPGLSLAFYNVGSWFIFSVTQDDIVSVTLRGHNNEDLAGRVKVTMDSESKKPFTQVLEGQKSITMTPAGGTFEVGESYYMVVIPGRMSGGLELSLTKSNGKQATWGITNDVTFTRSKYLRKLNVDGGLTFEPGLFTDLGLRVLWATSNIGANSPEEYGDYYAWGEVEPYYSSHNPLTWKSGKTAGYTWASYKWCNGSSSTLTKYNINNSRGVVDGKTVLDAEDDVANVILGGDWRMPTGLEFLELIRKCTWTWTSLNGVNGYLITSNVPGYTEESVFLPAAGIHNGKSFANAGSYGYYWSSDLDTENLKDPWHIGFHSSTYYRESYNARTFGQSIRPVQTSPNYVWATNVTLSTNTLSLVAGEEETLSATVLPSTANDKTVYWYSTNDAVVQVDEFTGHIYAINKGKAIIIAKAFGGNNITASCEVIVSNICPGNAVDLGIVTNEGYKLYWAKYNLGESGFAASERQYGAYYAWGETETKSSFSWSQYSLCNGSSSTLTKYNTDSTYGTVDNKTELDVVDDVAHTKLSDNWRLPTSEEWSELISNCTTNYYYNSGTYGWKITSNINANSIFLPFPGNKSEWGLNGAGSSGFYWSSSLNSNTPTFAIALHIDYNSLSMSNNTRCNGVSVRPVYE